MSCAGYGRPFTVAELDELYRDREAYLGRWHVRSTGRRVRRTRGPSSRMLPLKVQGQARERLRPVRVRTGRRNVLVDLASSKGLPQEDRTIVAWTITPTDVHRRDSSYHRGFPMAPDLGLPAERGHLIPHLSGGRFGPNIFRQDRALNRGWSEQGKRYRALERAAAGLPKRCTSGTCYTSRQSLSHADRDCCLTAWATFRVEQFDNRPGEQA
jgi:hypothetical protein